MRIRDLASRRLTFSFETTLAGRSYIKLLKNLKNDGYKINIYFIWIKNIELALKRIADRVRNGGHNIPDEDVRRRFIVGIRNLFLLYRPLVNYIMILDNSEFVNRVIAIGDTKKMAVKDMETYSKIEDMASTEEFFNG